MIAIPFQLMTMSMLSSKPIIIKYNLFIYNKTLEVIMSSHKYV